MSTTNTPSTKSFEPFWPPTGRVGAMFLVITESATIRDDLGDVNVFTTRESFTLDQIPMNEYARVRMFVAVRESMQFAVLRAVHQMGLSFTHIIAQSATWEWRGVGDSPTGLRGMLPNEIGPAQPGMR